MNVFDCYSKAASKMCFTVILGCLILIPSLASAQLRTVSGIVQDSSGKPLQGVAVTIEGKNKGTLSDMSGRFSISTATGSTLLFTSTGYESRHIKVDSSGTYTVILKESNSQLADVVINVGYGSQKKKDLTGSVSVIDKEMLENRPITNSIAALQGAAAGLIVTRSTGQPGLEGYNINIRGITSVNGNNTALVVVDGIPNADLSLVNPYDIESITVLKDAASAAIYGAQAAGGVILVTTKQGSIRKMRVEYTGIYTDNRRYNVPKLLAPWQQAQMVDTAQAHAGVGQSWAPWKIRLMQSDTNYLPSGTNLGTTPITIPATFSGYDYYTDYDHNMFLRNNAYANNQNVTASGGNSTSQYLFGLGYYSQNGVFAIGPDGYDRYNARMNINTKMSRIFSLRTNLSYTFAKTLQSILGPYINGDNGVLYNLYSRASSGVQTGAIYLPGTNLLANAGGADVYGALKYGGYNTMQQHTLTGAFDLSAAGFVKGLSIDLNYLPTLQQTNQDILAKGYTAYTPMGTTNGAISGFPVTYVPATYVAGTAGNGSTSNTNYFSRARTTVWQNDLQLLLNYDFNWSINNHLHALAGYEYTEYNNSSDYAKLINLVNTATGSLNFNSGTPNPYSASDNVQSYVWVSYFGRVTYDYKGKYLLQANIRDDGSSKLSPGYRYQIFPSISAGWRISQEKWFKDNVSAIDELKLRASYGTVGNANAFSNSNYAYIAQLPAGANTVFGNQINPSVYQSSLPSLGKGWEKIKTSDIGLDLSTLKNRLSITLDGYIRDNDNMLITINYPTVLGVGAAQTNSASMRTIGWETTVSWRDNVGKFNYSVTANLSDNTNKLTKYAGTTTVSQGVNSTIVGKSLGSIYGYKALGYYQSQTDVDTSAFVYAKTGPGDIKYANLDGNNYVNAAGRPVINSGANTVTDHGDLTYLGNTNPRYTFGITLQGRIAGFDVEMFFQGVGKRQMLIPTRTMVPFVQTYRTPWAEQTDAWTPSNSNAKFPRLYWYGSDAVETAMNGAISSHWVQDAKYISLKNLQIGYTLPAKMTQKIKIQKLRIFFTGQDIWRISGMWYKSFDPENPNNTAWNYPFFRSFSGGVNLTF